VHGPYCWEFRVASDPAKSNSATLVPLSFWRHFSLPPSHPVFNTYIKKRRLHTNVHNAIQTPHRREVSLYTSPNIRTRDPHISSYGKLTSRFHQLCMGKLNWRRCARFLRNQSMPSSLYMSLLESFGVLSRLYVDPCIETTQKQFARFTDR
jgi:hypothetical protein